MGIGGSLIGKQGAEVAAEINGEVHGHGNHGHDHLHQEEVEVLSVVLNSEVLGFAAVDMDTFDELLLSAPKDETTTLRFAEGIRLLRESGWKDDDDGSTPSEYEDLHTKAEKRLGELVKEKYHTGYYILDKFLTSAHPFYTMLDPTDDWVTNSFDFFVRGQEILSGGQRIHGAAVLIERLKKQNMDPLSFKEYIDGLDG